MPVFGTATVILEADNKKLLKGVNDSIKSVTALEKTTSKAAKNIKNDFDISFKSILKSGLVLEGLQIGKELFRDAIKQSEVLTKKLESIKKPITDIFGKSLEIVFKIPVVDMLFKNVVTGLNNVSNFLDTLNTKGLVSAAKESPGTALAVGGVASTTAIVTASIFGPKLAQIISKSINALFSGALKATKIDANLLMQFMDKIGKPLSLTEKIVHIIKNWGLLLSSLTGYISTIYTSTLSISTALAPIAAVLATITSTFAVINSALSGLREANDMFGQNSSIFGDIALFIQDLTGQLINLQPIFDGFSKAFNFIADGITSMVDSISNRYNKFIESFSKRFLEFDFSDEISRLAIPILSEENRKKRLTEQTNNQINTSRSSVDISRVRGGLGGDIGPNLFAISDQINKNSFAFQSLFNIISKKIVRLKSEISQDFGDFNTPSNPVSVTKRLGEIFEKFKNFKSEDMFGVGFEPFEKALGGKISEERPTVMLQGSVEAASIINRRDEMNVQDKQLLTLEQMFAQLSQMNNSGIKLKDVAIAN